MRKLEVPNKAELLSACQELKSHNDESRALNRLHCVLLVAQGISCYQVANWLGEHPGNVERWVHKFHSEGLTGIRSQKVKGRPNKIPTKLLRTISNDLADSPKKHGYDQDSWSGILLCSHLMRRYEIELSVRQCQRLLRQCILVAHANTVE